jgi:chaperonin cofactor prefoldin
MFSVFVSVILLISTPVQDSVSNEQIKEIETRLETLEERVNAYEKSEKYFDDILYGERMMWSVIITILIFGVGAFSYSEIKKEVDNVHEEFDSYKSNVENLREKHEKSRAKVFIMQADLKRKANEYGSAIINLVYALDILTKIDIDAGKAVDDVLHKLDKDVDVLLKQDIEYTLPRDTKSIIANIMSRVKQGSIMYSLFDIQKKIDKLKG